MVELSDKLTWSGYSKSARVNAGVGLLLCTAEDLTSIHIIKHFIFPFKTLSGDDISEKLNSYGFRDLEDAFMQLEESSTLAFGYDLITASLVNIKLDQALIQQTYKNVIDTFSKNPKYGELIEFSKQNMVLEKLFAMGRVFGQDFKANTDFDSEYKIPNSKFIKTYDNSGGFDCVGTFSDIVIPVYATPLFTDKSTLDNFLSLSKSGFNHIKGIDIDYERKKFQEKLENYQYELTKNLTPNTSELKDTLLNIRDYGDYLNE